MERLTSFFFPDFWVLLNFFLLESIVLNFLDLFELVLMKSFEFLHVCFLSFIFRLFFFDFTLSLLFLFLFFLKHFYLLLVQKFSNMLSSPSLLLLLFLHLSFLCLLLLLFHFQESLYSFLILLQFQWTYCSSLWLGRLLLFRWHSRGVHLYWPCDFINHLFDTKSHLLCYCSRFWSDLPHSFC